MGEIESGEWRGGKESSGRGRVTKKTEEEEEKSYAKMETETEKEKRSKNKTMLIFPHFTVSHTASLYILTITNDTLNTTMKMQTDDTGS